MLIIIDTQLKKARHEKKSDFNLVVI